MPEPPPPPRLRLFENSPGQRHIREEDRHLYARREPDYRIAIVGTGTMGQEHMRVAALIGRAVVHGVFDTQAESLAAADMSVADGGNSPRRYESLQALVTDSALDAIFICTPNQTHLAVLREVLAAGKPVFLEKPMATTLDDGRELAALARDHEAFVQLGLQYRYKAPYREAWQEIRDRRAIGNVKTLSMSEYRPPFLDKVGQWNKFAANSGGTLVEKCCHYFDLLDRFAGGRPERVFASGGQAVNFRDFSYGGAKADIDDHAFVTLEYADDIRASFTLNMFTPDFHEELIVSGDSGRLIASEHFDPQRDGLADSRVRVERWEPHAHRDTEVSYGAAIEGSGHNGATYHEHLAFLRRLDGHESDAATVSDGLWSLLVATAAQESMARGQAIHLQELIDRHALADYL